MEINIKHIDLTSISPETELKIQEAIDACDCSSVFHSVLWNRLLIKEFGLKHRALLALDGDEPIGLYIFYEDKHGDEIKILRSPIVRFRSVYGGPISIPGYESIIPRLLKESENSSSAKLYSIKGPPYYPDEHLRVAGYSLSEGATSIIDLREDESVLFNRIKKNARYHIRKSIKNGVEIVEGNSSNLDEFYDMFQSLQQRVEEKELYILPKEFCRSVWDEFGKRNQVVFLLGKLGEQFINGSINLCHKDTIYAWLLGSYPEFRRYDADSLMVWSLMRWGHENGYKFLDLLGLKIPSIAKFKRSFGGSDTPFCLAFKKGRSYYWDRLCFYLSHPKSLAKKFSKF